MERESFDESSGSGVDHDSQRIVNEREGTIVRSMRNVREPTLENHCRFPFLLLLYCFVALTFPRLSTSTRVHRPRRVRFTISRDRGVATFSTDNLSNANLHLFLFKCHVRCQFVLLLFFFFFFFDCQFNRGHRWGRNLDFSWSSAFDLRN